MTPYLEIGGEYREIAPGVWLAELPLPFSLGLINVYLLRLDDGWMLVDCGMDTPACRAALERALEGIGLAWSEIRWLLLTHFHPDHMGLAPHVLERSGARLCLHGADADLLREICDEAAHDAWLRGVYAASGVPASLASAMGRAMHEIAASFHPLAPAMRLEGGEIFPGPHGGWRAVWTPGHAPGHVCLYSETQRLLISGDHVLEHITPNIGWLPGTDALGLCLDSLETIAALDVDLVLPSHGLPFAGHRAWAERTRSHHLERSARVAELIAETERTADQVVRGLWTRDLSPLHYRFGLFEALAHLHRLRSLGAAEIATREGVEWWSAVPSSLQ